MMTADGSGGLGRLLEPEPAMAGYPLKVAQAAPVVMYAPYTRRARFTPILNQGQTGTCVGHAGAYAGLTAPMILRQRPDPFALYRLACANDEWTANDNGDLQYGTSVRGLLRGMRAAGLIESFYWANTVEACRDWMAGLDVAGKHVGGGLILGLNWYDSMFEVDAGGFLNITLRARLAGGHSIYADEWDDARDYIGGPQNWGYGFGRIVGGRPNGRWRMSLEMFARLLGEDGESAAAVEQQP